MPLEFVVRAYITGVTKTSLWFNYEAGARNIAGNPMPGGLRRNERLEAPVLTPTTKFEVHDRNLGRDDAIAEGLVTADLFDLVRRRLLPAVRPGHRTRGPARPDPGRREVRAGPAR